MAGDQIDPRVLWAAKRFEKEHKLHEWIRIQNLQKGLAPSSARILHEANRLEQDQEGHNQLRRSSGREPARTKWMQRFKRRWQLKNGTIQAGERVSQEEAKAQVGAI